jgi:hypothetical protein
MEQWQLYFHSPKLRKERGPLNVLSLEIRCAHAALRQ